MRTEPEIVAAALVAALDRLGVSYLVGGSIASSVHGFARATRDIDVVADLRVEQVSSLVAALQEQFYIDAGMILDAIARRGSFNVIHLETLFKADVFIPGDTAYAAEEMSRRVLARLGPDLDSPQVSVASPEDTVLHKLLWFQAGRQISDRQWGDLVGVLKVQGRRLDREYLQRWSMELGIEDLLKGAMVEAGLEL